MVSKGSLIYLTQITGKIAIDKISNSTYSYMVLISGNYFKLSETSNWRFYLNAVTSFSSYQRSLIITYTYSYIGLFDLSLTFLSSNTTYHYPAYITQCNYLIN